MSSSKITVFLRSATDELTKSLRENGFLHVQPERESELSALLEKFNDEMYGAPTSAGSPRRPKQTDVRVVAETTITYDRDYLTKQSVQELLRIAKAKGCKNLGPRKKESLIEKILQHLATPTEQTEVSSQNTDASGDAATDDELRAEPVPEPPKKPRKKKDEAVASDEAAATVVAAPVATSDEAAVPVVAAPVATGDAAPVKKGRKKKTPSESGSDDETKPKAVKKERKKAEKKVKEPPTPPPEEEEITIAVRAWIHPKDQQKPPSDRTKYCIDPMTNFLYKPDQMTDDPIGKWDDESQEIIPC